MSVIHHPHDRFAKASLKYKAIAIDLLKSHLPTELLNQLDMTSLQMIDKSYVSPELKAFDSDVVYRCKLDGKESYIPFLLLLEHQSTADEHMAFRLLEYTVYLMRDHLNANHERLPIVLPLCLYHGTVSPYPYSTDIYDDFDDPDLARKWVFQSFHLIDLTTKSLEKLQQDGLAAMMEILLKAYYSRNLRSMIEFMIKQKILVRTLNQTSQHYFDNMLHYSVALGDQHADMTGDDLLQLYQEALPDKQEQIMTFKEQLTQQSRKEGMKLGRKEGMHAAKREDAKKMLAKGIEYSLVKEITGLSDAELVVL